MEGLQGGVIILLALLALLGGGGGGGGGGAGSRCGSGLRRGPSSYSMSARPAWSAAASACAKVSLSCPVRSALISNNNNALATRKQKKWQIIAHECNECHQDKLAMIFIYTYTSQWL